MRCPECDTFLGDDVEGWLRARRKKHWKCPFCGWSDERYELKKPTKNRWGRKIA